jgi:hypothetical protein
MLIVLCRAGGMEMRDGLVFGGEITLRICVPLIDRND